MNTKGFIQSVIFSILFAFSLPVITFAADTLGDSTYNNDEETGIYSNTTLTRDDIRDGNITYEHIPMIIVSAIETILLLVGTVCVVAIIYHAVRLQVAGTLGDSSGVDRAKKGVYSAMMGFVLSMSAWFIMTRLVAIFAGIT